jgi:multidrug efflux pump subunit AcrA (membrane-fusion protein)
MPFRNPALSLIRHLFLAAALGAAPPLWAHAGHDHGPKVGGAAATGPVALSPQARLNLGLETVEADITTLRRTTALLARIQVIPEKVARLSARFDGQVGEIYVRLGQAVSAGEPLLKLVPKTIDTPAVVLRSPWEGVVMAQHAANGLPFTAETVLVEIADLRQVLARGAAYENSDLAAVREGTPVAVQLDFFRGESFSGRIERIAPALDPETRTFELYALLDNPETRLKPNLQGTMFVGVGEEVTGVAIPTRAVLGSTGNLFVFVETEPNTFERRDVTVGITAADRVEIVEGVLPGEKVVVRGNYQLQFAPGKPAATRDSTAKTASGQSAGQP